MTKRLVLICVAFAFAGNAQASPVGHSYPMLKGGVREATMAITSDQVVPGQFVAVWLGAGKHGNRSWVQAGITSASDMPNPMPGLCAYAESMTRSQHHTIRCIRPIAMGEPVTVKLTFSYRYGWVVWVDGVAQASVQLGSNTYTAAAAESYKGGSFTYRMLTQQ